MYVLHVTGMWPSEEKPHFGAFVKSQISGLRKIGIRCEVVFSYDKGLKKYLSIRKNTQTCIALYKPDIVHAHYGWVGAIIASACVSRKIPIIISYCGGDIHGEMGSFFRSCKFLLGKHLSFWGGTYATRVIVKSKALLELLPRKLRAKALVLPNGVNTDLFFPLSRKEARCLLGWEDSPVVLFAGRPDDPTKNFNLARLAVAEARKKIPEIKLKIPIGVPHDQMPIWLNASDVLLMTSFKEGSPNIVKEALACGLPIVSVNVADVPWLLNGLKGCFVVDYDVAALADRLVKSILEDVDPWILRDRILDMGLDLETVSFKLASLYNEVV